MVKFKLWDGKVIPMLEREEWGAVEENLYRKFECMELPITHVRFCYDDILTRFNTTETALALRECQREHMEVQGYEDIRFNFAISPEGIIFECRGWYTVPAPPPKYEYLNYKLLDIAFIGDFSEKDPPWPMMKTALLMVMKGLKSMYINSNFRLIGLRDEPD